MLEFYTTAVFPYRRVHLLVTEDTNKQEEKNDTPVFKCITTLDSEPTESTGMKTPTPVFKCSL
jgi:hypothetical protein